jgi:hypothetical protein
MFFYQKKLTTASKRFLLKDQLSSKIQLQRIFSVRYFHLEKRFAHMFADNFDQGVILIIMRQCPKHNTAASFFIVIHAT